MGKSQLAILGTGRVGRAVAGGLIRAGRSILFGSRTPQSAAVSQLAEFADVEILSIEEAVQRSQICLLAVPWKAAKLVAASIPDWESRTLIDCSNPLNSTFNGLELGFESSAAEEIAKVARGAHVVKTLNTASSDLMSQPRVNDQATSMFYCGDDASAKQAVHEMLEQLGFDPLDAGPLKQARYLEPLAMLSIDLAIRGGLGSKWGLKVLR